MKLNALTACLLVSGMFASAQRAGAMATERVGPDLAAHPQPGWYKGIVEPLKHPSRVYSIWVNGNENFYFNAMPDGINELLSQYSKARLRDHEVVIKKSPGPVKSFAGPSFDYNVSIQLIDGIALYAMSEQSPAETLEPVLTIFVSGNDTSMLKDLKFPDNVVVRSEVEGFIPISATKPVRKTWYGLLNFDDGTPAVNFGAGVMTKFMLWTDDSEDGFPLPGITHEGYSRAVLSGNELAALKSRKMWLTLTVGNSLTQPKKTDARFPANLLGVEKTGLTAHQIPRPNNYFYGRIVFEDGSPAIINPKPWPGAELSIDFPYAGRATLDSEGYFKLYFDPEQMFKLLQERPRKNIYTPTEQQGRSTALDAFPPGLLSQDKATAGVVRIPKPKYMAEKQ